MVSVEADEEEGAGIAAEEIVNASQENNDSIDSFLTSSYQ